MIEIRDAFPGFAVRDVEAALAFYRDVLGLEVVEAMGGFRFALPSGQSVFVYGKPDHSPAPFTILNFEVDDIDAAVDALNAAGVVTKIYSGEQDFGTDERGIARGRESGMGPDICWFRDPSDNVLSVLRG
ncbi:VOC family protein [Agromyces sp. NPDC060279]|uniref:VOC family protein n=1 Tax=Agromyces sp. NPDC060279 TaxID=3347092 RepID=UPI003662EEC0